jgi:dipeptidyl-peptidase 4
MQKKALFFILTILSINLSAQQIKWAKDGVSYFRIEGGGVSKYTLPANQKSEVISKDKLIPAGKTTSLTVKNFLLSDDNSKVLIFTNSKRVWRYETRGDYWVYDFTTNQLKQLGKGRPESTLMFAKFSPDAKKVAYVSERNIYVEDLASGQVKALTSTNGTKKLINGTFDWVYEEEFDCRDGFRWSSDSRKIAYWQIDANQIRDYSMVNFTDSVYSKIIPVEYPKVGEAPSPYKIGVIDLANDKTTWMKIEGDPRQNYIPRMEWAVNADEIIVQQLNRKQNQSKLIICNSKSGDAKVVYEEKDEAWVDVRQSWEFGMAQKNTGWDWINSGKEYVWVSEKDGWRHAYRVSRDGKSENLLTKGDYDIQQINAIDETNNYLYFLASPENATQQYLYRVRLDGSSTTPEQLSPADLKGTHTYQISPTAKFAQHSFNSHLYQGGAEWVSLPENLPINPIESIASKVKAAKQKENPIEFFQITTVDGVKMDGWIQKPVGFDESKRYPVVFNVYTEPASTTVNDTFYEGGNQLYMGNMAREGYIYISLDGRGTPAPKGRAWRKAIYRKIGVVNIRDQAMACKEIRKWKYVDTTRIAVHGWSGGGSTTLNLLFQYPDLYQTGIAVAAVANQLTYDNIYQERYMGLPQENREDFVAGSPITHAKNLKGNLLYIHGTGDDNVHYQNAEMLINELVKYNKQFQLMIYPNRSHGIYEGQGTSLHLATLFTNYLKQYCPPGGR